MLFLGGGSKYDGKNNLYIPSLGINFKIFATLDFKINACALWCISYFSPVTKGLPFIA